MKDFRIRTCSVELQVRDHQGDGDPLIFLHFGGGNLMMWSQTLPFFQQEYRVIVPDLRGHGKSDKPETGNDIETMAKDVVLVMDQLAIKQAHLVGSSLGAEVALSLAAGFPDRVKSIVCEGALYSEFGPYSTWEGTESEYNEFTAKQLELASSTAEKVYSSAEAYVAEKKRIFQQYGWWNENVKAVEEYDAFRLPSGKYTAGWRKHSRIAYQRSYFGYRFEDYYRQITCPVLMLPGSDEIKNPGFREIAEGLRKLTKQGKLVEVEGWIHPYGWMLNCDKICETILNFFQ